VAFVPFPQEGDDVQKKTFALAGLAVAAAGGVLLSGSPADAGVLVQGHRHHHYSSRNYNRNANWNRNHNRVVVRVNVRNHNVNTAFAGREHDENDSDFGLFRHRGCGFRCNRFEDEDRGFGREDEERGDNIIVGNDIRTAGERGLGG
jgi:hypothetical protein